ncbi:putative pectate lyase 5 [Camellia lanceoleosa]|uniref:Pectate lyase 5 n=1 Tax=Camellia lanceoleosa TaxID=1840588 RepID=A0ACC0IWA0_9ERIC|nr:putative pectate lyase 5 [Camellia lanceoleosa]
MAAQRPALVPHRSQSAIAGSCDPNWANSRQRLRRLRHRIRPQPSAAKGSQIYVVTDSSDDDPANQLGHTPLRRDQSEPLLDHLLRQHAHQAQARAHHEQLQNHRRSGANIRSPAAAASLQYISNVIIHNIHVSHCVPRETL